MIKAEISETKKEPVNEYPKLMIHKDGSIVLFTEEDTGVILYDTIGDNELYRESYDWKTDEFTDFHGAITLSNEELTK